jgi:hypothetical protein
LATGNWRRSENLDLAKGTPLVGSGFDTWSGLIKGTAHFGENDEQTLRLSYQRWFSDAKDQAYAQTGTQAAFGIIDRTVIDQTATLSWENPDLDNPWVDLNVNLTFSDTTNEQTNHRPFLGGPRTPNAGTNILSDTTYGYRTWQLSADNTVEWIGDGFENYLTVGFQASTLDRSVKRPAPSLPLPAHAEGTEDKLGLFVQNEFIWDERLTLIAGARGDFQWIKPVTAGLQPRNGSAFSPKLAAHYEINDTVSVFGSVAHTERMPTIDELYAVSAAKFASHNLQTEYANTVEGGFSLSGYDLLTSGDTASIKTTGFYSDLTNMIVSNTGVGVPYYGNIGAARIYGVEVEGAYNSEQWFANLAYSVTIGDNLVTNTPPHHRAAEQAGGDTRRAQSGMEPRIWRHRHAGEHGRLCLSVGRLWRRWQGRGIPNAGSVRELEAGHRCFRRDGSAVQHRECVQCRLPREPVDRPFDRPHLQADPGQAVRLLSQRQSPAALRGCRLLPAGPSGGFALHEADAVAERVGDHHFEAPIGILQARPHRAVVLGQEFGVKRPEALRHVDDHVASRRGVTGMFGQVQRELATRDLGVQWGVIVEAMLPIDRETQEIEIEFVRFRDIENAHDGHGALEDDLIALPCP